MDNETEFLKAMQDDNLIAINDIHTRDPKIFHKFQEGKIWKQWIICRAAKECSSNTIDLLARLGADLNEQDSNGWTGLCWAVTKGRYDAVKTLLERGANTSIHCAIFGVTSRHNNEPVAMAKLLLDHGADVNELYIVEGMPPRNVLSEAIATGNNELVEFLKSRGAELPPQPTSASLIVESTAA